MPNLEDRVNQRTHELSEANKHLNLQAAALEAAANAIVITDSHGAIMWVNHAFTTMTGYSKEESLGKNPRLLKSGEQPESLLRQSLVDHRIRQSLARQIVNRRKDGTLTPKR